MLLTEYIIDNIMRENIKQKDTADLEKENYDLKQLLIISRSLNSTLNHNIIIDSMLLICMGQMQTMKAGIFLKGTAAASNLLLERNCKGFEIETKREYSIPPKSILAETLLKPLKCLSKAEMKAKVPREETIELTELLGVELAVPVTARGQLLGIIILGEKLTEDEYSDEEKKYAIDIAGLAGIAIQNANLFNISTTDQLTQLKNRYYFLTIMEDEILRARSGGPKDLSVIMIDIDHFKQFNDTYGHLCGDFVLKNLGMLLYAGVRKSDTAARYGGEEFILLLPKADLPIAERVAERIRKSVELTTLNFEGKTIKFTISLGIAQYKYELKETDKKLIERADKALYDAKHAGRNRVCLAQD
jgi:diguanylate cyclase (GGDEF)-like protein